MAIVLLSHFAPLAWKRRLPAGSRGVELFFVLSGFLISSILWRGRVARETGAAPASRIWKRFLFRRTLRIFPIYYLMIAIAVAAGLGITVHEVKWYASYLSNVYFVRQRAMDGPAMPLWSLAVEEQFYLLWPAVLLFLSRRPLTIFLAAAVTFSPAYRYWGTQHGLWGRPLLLPGCLDLFALGAILAIVSVEESPKKLGIARASLAISALLWWIAKYRAPVFSPIGISLERSAMGFFSLWLVAGADRGFPGPGRWLLESRPVVYLGRISYGIYLYHSFVAAAADRFLERRGLSPLNPQLRVILLSALTVLCAAASWHFLEAPIARWKDRIGRPAAAAGSSHPASA